MSMAKMFLSVLIFLSWFWLVMQRVVMLYKFSLLEQGRYIANVVFGSDGLMFVASGNCECWCNLGVDVVFAPAVIVLVQKQDALARHPS